MKAFKIVEQHADGVRTLFHGLHGSRRLEPGRWLRADQREVRDGTSKTTYLSGWHVLPTREDCEAYLEKFTERLDRLRIIECEVRNPRPKTHSPSPVFLAEYLFIRSF
jgi:hypothetical protein